MIWNSPGPDASNEEGHVLQVMMIRKAFIVVATLVAASGLGVGSFVLATGAAATGAQVQVSGPSTVQPATAPTSGPGNGNGGTCPGNSCHPFTISGSAVGLYPGKTIPVVLTVSNTNNFAISVTSLTVTPGDASSSCRSTNLTAGPFNGPLNIAANSSAQTSIDVTMSVSAPNACQRAQFPLSYSGQAAKS